MYNLLVFRNKGRSGNNIFHLAISQVLGPQASKSCVYVIVGIWNNYTLIPLSCGINGVVMKWVEINFLMPPKLFVILLINQMKWGQKCFFFFFNMMRSKMLKELLLCIVELWIVIDICTFGQYYKKKSICIDMCKIKIKYIWWQASLTSL